MAQTWSASMGPVEPLTHLHLFRSHRLLQEALKTDNQVHRLRVALQSFNSVSPYFSHRGEKPGETSFSPLRIAVEVSSEGFSPGVSLFYLP
jgi:hypothetical protein